MGEEAKDYLNLLSMKDFEERGIKIDRKWNGFKALMAVADLASQKLEEEEKIRIEKEIKKNVIELNWHHTLGHCRALRQGSSSRSNDIELCLGRVFYKNESEKTLKEPVIHMDSKKVKDPFENGRYKKSSVLKIREKALKKPVTNSVSDMYSKKKKGFVSPTRDKLLGDAMKASIRAREDGDDEWVAEYTKQLKKCSKRSVSNRDNSEEKGSKPKKKLKRVRYVVPSVRPDLPQEFRERIENLNGSKIELVIQKCLFFTDISFHHRRLSIPLNQIISKSFLTEEERRDIDNGGEMLVRFIEPSLHERKLTFKRWMAQKDEVKSKNSFCYVLISEWNKVREENKLEIGDLIQVWSFRMPADELCLALVLVRRVSDVGENDGHNNGGDDANGSQGTEEKDGANNGRNDQSPSSACMGSTTTQVSTS